MEDIKIGDVFIVNPNGSYPTDLKIQGYGRIIIIEESTNSLGQSDCFWIRNIETNKSTTFSRNWITRKEWVRCNTFKMKLKALL